MQPCNLAFVSQVNALTAFFGGSGKGPGPALMGRAEMYQELNVPLDVTTIPRRRGLAVRSHHVKEVRTTGSSIVPRFQRV
jgi:hypothetical protein